MNNSRNKLEHWRSKIDSVDAELLELLNRRGRIACEIASIKVASGLPAYDPQRETQVLSKIAALNQGPLDHQSVQAIFSSVIRETRRLGTEKMQQLVASREADGTQDQCGLAIEAPSARAAHEQ